MASHLFPLGDNVIDDSATTVSAGTTAPTAMPLTNLQDSDLSKRTRLQSVTATLTRIVFDLGSAKDIQGVAAIGFANATTSAQIQIELASDSGFTTDVVDGGAITIFPSWVDDPSNSRTPRSLFHVFSSEYSRRYIRVRLIDASNPDGYLDLRRVVAGRVFTPTHSYSPGASFTARNRGAFALTRGGQPAAEDVPRGRVARVTLQGLSRRERHQMTEMFDLRTAAPEVCWVPDDTLPQADRLHEDFHGYLRAPTPANWYAQTNTGQLFERSIEIIERTVHP